MKAWAERLRRAVQLPALRAKDWLRLAVLLGIVAVVIVVELTSGEIREFYRDRPLQAGVITGALLSAVAYFGFDAIRAQLHESRWAPLSKLAFVSLSYQTTLVIDALLWLATEIKPVNDAKPDDPLQQKLVDIRRAAGRPEPQDDDLGAVQCAEYRESLEVLLDDPAWVKFAITQLDRAKWRNRAGIATWAASMLSTGEAAAVLNRLAQVNESLSITQEWLRTLAGQPGYEDREASVGGALEAWIATHAEAVSVREDLMRAARSLPPQYPKFREAVLPAARAELARRERRAGEQAGARKMLVTAFGEPPSLPPMRAAQ